MTRQEALEEAGSQMKILDQHHQDETYSDRYILVMLGNVVYNLRQVID